MDLFTLALANKASGGGSVPTKLSQLSNDMGFVDEAALEERFAETAADFNMKLNRKQDLLLFDNVPTQDSKRPVRSGGVYDFVKEQISGITSFAYYLCGTGEYDAQGVPTVQNPDTSHIYLTPTSGTNLNMYAYIGGAFTFLGTTEMDLSGYVTEQELAEYVPELPENVSAFINDAGYITNPRTVLWNYRPPKHSEMPAGYIGNAEHVYYYSAEASADTVAALQAAATQQVYLNRSDQPLTADPESEGGEVLLTYNLKATETEAEMQVDVDDTSKPFFIVSLGAEEEAASGFIFMVITGTPPEDFDWILFTEGAYLTQHQSLAAYPKTSELAAVAMSGRYADLTGRPTIPTVPTRVSAFTNDAGYLTQHQSLANVNAAKVNGYTVVVQDTAPAAGTSDHQITIVVPQ